MLASNFKERIKKLELKHYLTVAIFFVIFVGSIIGIYNYRQDSIKPLAFEVTRPESGIEVYESSIVFEGHTKRNKPVVIAEVKTKSDRNGDFSVEVPLKIGENQIKVVVGEGREESSRIVIVKRRVEKASVPVNSVLKKEKLNSSGPETLYLGEIFALTGSYMLYRQSKLEKK